MQRAVTAFKRAFATKPWYVNEIKKPAREPLNITLPENPPHSLSKVLHKLDDYGLQNLEILDSRQKQTALGPSLMILATGLGARHLGRATEEFKGWLKQEFQTSASTEGVLSSNFLRTWRRRAKRRQERQRSYAPSLEVDPTLQQKTGEWIVVDTKLDNIYVHMLTSDKRQEMDLESVLLERGEDPADLHQDYVEPSGTPSGTGGIRSYSTSTVGRYVGGPVGRRLYSTQNTKVLDMCVETIDGKATLPELCECVQQQLIDGGVLTRRDLTHVLTAITYHRHCEFEQKRVTKETQQEWAAVCDAKAKALLMLCDVVTRPRGELLLNSNAYMLIWRAFVTPSVQSVDPVSAMENPTPVRRLNAFTDKRFPAMVEVLNDQNLYLQPQVLVSVCAALINGNYWTTFWSLLTKADLRVDLPSSVLEPIIAMVVKSGRETQITYGLQTFLPSLYRGQFVPSDALKRIIRVGMKAVDDSNAKLNLNEVLAT